MKERHRPHVYELDPLRTTTAVSVVGVHVLAFTFFLTQSDIGVQVQNAAMIALHFTREVFMFVTAFALAYVYYGKPFNLKRFWGKRSVGVLLPYCLWSVIYLAINAPAKTPLGFVEESVLAIVRGTASYQLYYILLTLQFYLILPLFLIFLKRVAHHPWKTLVVSFVVQVALLYADYHFLQQGTLTSTSPFWGKVLEYQDRFVLAYPFYFILGGLAALYLEQVRAFLLRNGWIIGSVFLFALAVLWLHFVVQIRVYQDPMANATSVLQPIMAFYSLVIIIFAFWLASRWATRTGEDGSPRGHRFWSFLSDTSFGIYLVHALVLTQVLQRVVPLMPGTWPSAIRIFLVWAVTVTASTAITAILLKIPILSRTVGREHSARRKAVRAEKQGGEQASQAEAKPTLAEGAKEIAPLRFPAPETMEQASQGEKGAEGASPLRFPASQTMEQASQGEGSAKEVVPLRFPASQTIEPAGQREGSAEGASPLRFSPLRAAAGGTQELAALQQWRNEGTEYGEEENRHDDISAHRRSI